jgi:hypothetical protein
MALIYEARFSHVKEAGDLVNRVHLEVHLWPWYDVLWVSWLL